MVKMAIASNSNGDGNGEIANNKSVMIFVSSDTKHKNYGIINIFKISIFYEKIDFNI